MLGHIRVIHLLVYSVIVTGSVIQLRQQYTCVYVCTCICMYVYMYVYVYLCVYACVSNHYSINTTNKIMSL